MSNRPQWFDDFESSKTFEALVDKAVQDALRTKWQAARAVVLGIAAVIGGLSTVLVGYSVWDLGSLRSDLDSKVAAFDKQHELVTSEMTKISTDLSSLESRAAAGETLARAVTSTYDATQQSINAQMTALKDNTRFLSTQQQHVSDQLDPIEGRVTSLKKQLSDVAGAVPDLAGRDREADGVLKEIKLKKEEAFRTVAGYPGLDGRVTTLENWRRDLVLGKDSHYYLVMEGDAVDFQLGSTYGTLHVEIRTLNGRNQGQFALSRNSVQLTVLTLNKPQEWPIPSTPYSLWIGGWSNKIGHNMALIGVYAKLPDGSATTASLGPS